MIFKQYPRIYKLKFSSEFKLRNITFFWFCAYKNLTRFSAQLILQCV